MVDKDEDLEVSEAAFSLPLRSLSSFCSGVSWSLLNLYNSLLLCSGHIPWYAMIDDTKQIRKCNNLDRVFHCDVVNNDDEFSGFCVVVCAWLMT